MKLIAKYISVECCSLIQPVLKKVLWTFLTVFFIFQNGFSQLLPIDSFSLKKEVIGKVSVDSFDVFWETIPDYKSINGLPKKAKGYEINCYLEDERGIIWFGTETGLIKYDSYGYEIYDTDDGLCDNHINALFEYDNSIWIGTDSGISRLEKGIIKCLDSENTSSVTSIKGIKNEGIWIVYLDDRIRFYQKGIWHNYPPFHLSYQFEYIELDSLNRLWINTVENGLVVLEENNWKQFCFYSANKLSAPAIRLDDNKGNLWISYFAGKYKSFRNHDKLLHFNIYSEKTQKYDDILEGIDEVFTNEFEEVFVKTINDRWLQIEQEEVCAILDEPQYSDPYEYDFFFLEEFDFQDISGTKWFTPKYHSLPNGPQYYNDDMTNNFNLISTGFHKKYKKDLDFTLKYFDNKESFWGFVTVNDTIKIAKIYQESLIIYSFEGYDFERISSTFPVVSENNIIWRNEKNIFQAQNGLLFKIIRTSKNIGDGVTITNKKLIWTESNYHIVICINELCEKFKINKGDSVLNNLFLEDFDNMLFTYGQEAFFDADFLVKKDKKGNLWFLEGFNFLKKQDISLISGQDIYRSLHSYKNRYKQSVAGIWHLTENPKLPAAGSSHPVHSIHFGKDNIIWCFENKLVFKLNSSNNSPYIDLSDIKEYRLKNRYFSHNGLVVSSISGDKNDNFWIGFENDTSYVIDIISYNPIFKDTVVPLIYMKDIKLFNQSINWTDIDYLESKNISFKNWGKHFYVPNEMNLPYVENKITFEFRGIQNRKPIGTQYKYRLLENKNSTDTIWSSPVKEPIVTYANLQPGIFTFEVKSCNADNFWSEPFKYNFTINPPWWKTTWFISFFIASLIIIPLIFYRKWEKIKIKIREKSLKNLRDDFHDDNKNTVFAMRNTIVEAKQHTDEPVIIKQQLHKLQDYSNQIYEDMGVFINSLTIKPTNLYETIAKIQARANLLFPSGLPEFRMQGMAEVDQIFEDKEISAVESREIQLLFKEAMSNAKKYSKGENVWLMLKVADNKAIVCLKDNGFGFDKNQIKKGVGLDSLKTRADKIKANIEIESIINEGTTITLEIKLDKKNVYSKLDKFYKKWKKVK